MLCPQQILIDVSKPVKSSEAQAMDVAIIGSGNVGGALARAFTRSGHNVTITARNGEHAGEVARATGARAVATNVEAVRAAGVIVLATPFGSAADIAAEIREAAAGRIIVDTTNRMSFGPNGPDMDTSTSNAEELAALLPDSRVVKAFNTLFASNQADPVLDDVQLDGFVAGDDAAAKAAVLSLVASIGLEPVDVGPLARARQLEALAFLNISLNATNNGSWRSGWKLVAAPATVESRG
jgi:NADPH-dependent F420 reductase